MQLHVPLLLLASREHIHTCAKGLPSLLPIPVRGLRSTHVHTHTRAWKVPTLVSSALSTKPQRTPIEEAYISVSTHTHIYSERRDEAKSATHRYRSLPPPPSPMPQDASARASGDEASLGAKQNGGHCARYQPPVLNTIVTASGRTAERPFQALEQLLPASLWSPSFIAQRAQYTLNPLSHVTCEGSLESTPAVAAPSPSAVGPGSGRWLVGTSPSSSSEATPAGGAPGAAGSMQTYIPKDCAGTLLPTSASQQRHERGQQRQHALPASLPPRWSLMAMQRCFIRARYPNGVGFAARAPSSVVSTPTSSSSSHVAAGVGGHRDDGGTAENARDSADASFVLVESDDESCEAEDAVSYGACRASLPRSAQRSLFPSQGAEAGDEVAGSSRTGLVEATPLSAEVAATVLAAALDVLEGVLAQVRELHCTACPLCSPSLAPSWFCHEGRRKQRKQDARDTPHSHPAKPEAPQGQASSEGARHGADTAGLAGRRARLLRQANDLLAFHRGRVEYLRSTRPVMYATPAEHELIVQCRELGGMALLEALLIAL